MGAKATFNATTRIIKLTEAPDGDGIVNLDVQVDLYGDQKEDWLSTPALRKVRPPFSTLGGNPTPTGFLGDTYFLRSDWKIEPYDADQRLIVTGNLYSVDGTSPYIKPTGGTYSVFLEATVSNLVDSTVANLEQLQATTFIGKEGVGVTVDPLNGSDSATFPVGNRENPCKTEANIIAIELARGFRNIYLKTSITITTDHSGDPNVWFGDSPQTVFITCGDVATYPNKDVTASKFQDCFIQGELDAQNIIWECVVGSIQNANGFIYQSTIIGPIVVSDNLSIERCWVAPSATNQEITIDFNSVVKSVLISSWNGGRVLVKNMVTGSVFYMQGSGGKVTLDATCTGGTARIYGGIEVVNSATLDDLDDDTLFTRTDQIWTGSLVESYPVDGQSSVTPAQMLYSINQMLSEFARSGVTVSVKKRNGTEAFQLTLDSATAPTSSTQSS